MGWLLFY